jgi:hypothetical protein
MMMMMISFSTVVRNRIRNGTPSVQRYHHYHPSPPTSLLYVHRKHWNSSVTTTTTKTTTTTTTTASIGSTGGSSSSSGSSNSTGSIGSRMNNNPIRQRRTTGSIGSKPPRHPKIPRKIRNNDYYSADGIEIWDGLFRPGMTTPLRIKLNHYTSSSRSNNNKVSPPLVVVDADMITTYTSQVTDLLLNYSTKNIHRREDVRDALRTQPNWISLLSTLEQLLQQSSQQEANLGTESIATDSSFDDDDDNNNINTESDSKGNVVYEIFKNVEMESLLKLRVEIEEWTERYEILKLDRFLELNDLNDDATKQEIYQQKEMELSVMKRWTKLFVTVILHSIQKYVVVRRIQPSDVSVDLVIASTVHVDLPDHYNHRFNPFTGTHHRVYGVYLNKAKRTLITRDPLIPSRIIESPLSSPEQGEESEEPIIILCVSLQPRIPRSLREIFCAETTKRTASNTTQSVVSSTSATEESTGSNSSTTTPRTVATFYSILNVQHDQYAGLKLGEYLIHEAVKMLQDESFVPMDATNAKDNRSDIIHIRNEATTAENTCAPIDTFVTLSPLPGFCTWVLNEIEVCTMYNDPDYFYNEATGQGIIRKKPALYHTVKYLSRQWACREEDVVMKITDYLYARSERERNKEKTKSQRKKPDTIPINGIETPDSMSPNSSPQIQAAMRYFLEGMAAHYVVHAKIADTNGTSAISTSTETNKPTNGVARFHLQNGAEVYRINAFADLSLSGINSSLSVMVNYRYNLSQLQYNQAQYKKNYTVAIHDYVKQQLQ